MENGTGKSSKCGNPVCCPLLFSGRCLSRISCVFKLYKRKLRELFTKKERGIEWESGQELVSADTFSVIKQKEDLLRIHLSGSGQKARNLYQAQQEASSMAEILEGGTDSLYHRYVYW